MKRIFIAGTDTEVGKTTVTTLWMQRCVAAGHKVVGIKPVSAGCEKDAGVWRNDDAFQLQQHANVPLSYAQVNPVALREPLSPHLAAKRDGVEVTADGVQDDLRFLNGVDADVAFIEGAGGWYCPINDEETLADLVVANGWPVVLVVAMRLGCLNMALLNARALQVDGVKLEGWIANSLGAPMEAYEENVATLRARLPAPLLAEVHAGPRAVWHEASERIILLS